MPIVTAVIVLVFGGLTLVLHDELFIKLKPTIIYVLFGGALFCGLAFKKPLLGIVFDSVFNLTEEGWRKLTWRWTFFFLVSRRPQRDRVAHADDRLLGELQGVRRRADHLHLRRAAVSVADEARYPGEGKGPVILRCERACASLEG